MSTNATLAMSLNTISNHLNQYLGIFVFLFGCIGNILNILVLSQRTFRSNPCSLLFLASSISNLIAILFGLTSRILAGWNLDPTSTLNWLCKLRVIVGLPARTAAFWFIMLAAVDRWLVSSVHARYRQLSTVRNARLGGMGIILFSIMVYIHAPICFEIAANNFPLQCFGKTKLCRISIDLVYGIITIALPIILMGTFSFKTILNIRRMKKRIHPTQIETIHESTGIRTTIGRHTNTTDRLFLMLSVQIILFTILTFPFAIQRMYATVTMNDQKSALQSAIENLVYNLLLLLNFLAHGIPFYIYTLTGGHVFRAALTNVVCHLF